MKTKKRRKNKAQTTRISKYLLFGSILHGKRDKQKQRQTGSTCQNERDEMTRKCFLLAIPGGTPTL
jgi:hypothetical protein